MKGNYRVCPKCGKLQNKRFDGWDTDGYVVDPLAIVNHYKNEEQKGEETKKRFAKMREETVLYAKDYVPKIGEPKDV